MTPDLDRDPSQDGVLRTPPDDAWALERAEPSPALTPFLVWHWAVTWDLRDGAPHHQVTLPHPSPHVVAEPDGVWLYGPQSRRFERTLEGAGRVVGTRFRPGAIRALLDGPVSEVADARVDAAALRGLDTGTLTSASTFDELEATLAPLLGGAPSPQAQLADRAVGILEADRSVVRVGQLADLLGMSPRSVHRLFREHVGLGPSTVIRRYRLHEAAAAASAGGDVDWARLAADLGYADQAHLVRDFRESVGAPPARYAAGG